MLSALIALGEYYVVDNSDGKQALGIGGLVA